MQDEDRGMIKWAPFASVVDPNYLVNNICEKKDKIEKPIFTEEILNEFEELIKYSLETKEIINIEYYKNGKIYKIKESVIKIDALSKNIYLTNNIKLHFNNIVNIQK